MPCPYNLSHSFLNWHKFSIPNKRNADAIFILNFEFTVVLVSRSFFSTMSARQLGYQQSVGKWHQAR